MFAVPRSYSPTPLFLVPNSAGYKGSPPCLPFLDHVHTWTPLFVKGRSAAAFLLKYLKACIPDKSEVVLPGYTAQSLAFAVIHCGLKPVLADINPSTGFPSYTHVEIAVSRDTLCVFMPYNWGMFPSIGELKHIQEIAKINKCILVDDFASSAPFGDLRDFFNRTWQIALFSYGKTKLMTIMDGGSVCFSKRCRQLAANLVASFPLSKRQHTSGQSAKRIAQNFLYRAYSTRLGFYILSVIGAAHVERIPTSMDINLKPLGRGWEGMLAEILDEADRDLERRQKVFCRYFEQLEPISGNGLHLFGGAKGHAGSRFPLLFETSALRDKAIRLLQSQHIGATLGHLHWLPEFDLLKPHFIHVERSSFPGCVELQDRLITLPAHSKITSADVDNICQQIRQLVAP